MNTGIAELGIDSIPANRGVVDGVHGAAEATTTTVVSAAQVTTTTVVSAAQATTTTVVSAAV
ncbi:hypothetical protein [Streptomyces sp. NPDC006997]|uniref:hypothetical protein n=1 Tax=Streptomyces sp. NPDC006997 TaxID=3155356 RepID=UPI00340ACE8F